jgi:hypothetical protein
MTTVCIDPRCVSAQRCQRAEHEDFGNAPGTNYGPRCIPAPPAVGAHIAEVAYLRAEVAESEARRLQLLDDAGGLENDCRDLRAENERLRAQRILSNEDFARSFDMGLAAGEKRERAAVVAWLREESERRFPRDEREQGIVFRLAHEIERGEHRREEERWLS